MNWLSKATLAKHANSLKPRTSQHEIQMRTTGGQGRRAVDILLSMGNRVCVGNPTTEIIPVKTAAVLGDTKLTSSFNSVVPKVFAMFHNVCKKTHGELTRKTLNNK